MNVYNQKQMILLISDVDAKIIVNVNNIVNEICVIYNDIIKDTPIQEFVSFDDQRIMINECISKKNNTNKTCMQDLNVNQNIFVNVAYLPSKSYGITNMSRWLECKIIAFCKKQIKVRSIDDKMDGDYYFHPDSKDEVACSLECEWCCYN